MDTDRGGPDAADGTEEPGEPGEPGDLNDGLTLPGPDPPADLVEGAVDEGWAMQLFRNGRTNALIAWAMVTVLAGVFVESLFDFDLLSMALIGSIAAVVVAPAVAARTPRAMLPWELLGLALLPILVRALLGGELGIFATYLAIAALALAITVDLHMFTTLRVTHWFAVVLVVMTTMAPAAVWTILRWNADRMYDTAYLSTNEALMIEWIYVTLAGIVAGTLFDAYFRQRGVRLRRALQRVVRR
jgi:hypothetical protein